MIMPYNVFSKTRGKALSDQGFSWATDVGSIVPAWEFTRGTTKTLNGKQDHTRNGG